MRRLILIALFLEIGLLLLVVPWSVFWDRNYFTEAWPLVRNLAGSHFTRGAVTGIGLLNLYAAFAELADLVTGGDSDRKVRSQFPAPPPE